MLFDELIIETRVVIPKVYMEYLKLSNVLTEIILTDKNFTIEKINETCPICFEEICTNDGIITDCGHKYCKSCILGTIWSYMKYYPNTNPSCPMCRQELHINLIYPIYNK